MEINTAPSGGPGQTLKAANLLAEKLKAAGFPADDVRVLGLEPGDGNLVARYRSPRASRRPILLMAHLDVVEAARAEWDTDPFTLVEKDGYLYGRGTADLKNGAAILVALFIRLREEGFRPDRDLILFLTADEETTMANTRWLATEQRALVDAAFALNHDAGYVDVDGERPEAFVMQTAEKLYASFRLEATSAERAQLAADSRTTRSTSSRRRCSACGLTSFPAISTTARGPISGAGPPSRRPSLKAGALALGAGRLDDPAVDEIEKSPYLKAMLRTTCVADRARRRPRRERAPGARRGGRELPDPAAVIRRGGGGGPAGAGRCRRRHGDAHGAGGAGAGLAARPARSSARRGRRRGTVARHSGAARR